jgi:hypothetical protein
MYAPRQTAGAAQPGPRHPARGPTGLSRVSCRDASGLAVLMGTGRRAGLPGVSRLGAPAPPVARLLCITGAGRQIDIFSRCPGRHHRPGGWPAPRFRRSGRRRRHQALPAPGKPGPQAAPGIAV